MYALRSEFGGPEFEPHITVVGAIRLQPEDALRHFRAATADIKPYATRIVAVDRGSFSCRSVCYLVDPVPEVVKASAHCCNHFGYESSILYMPHLSLLYGDFTDKEKEQARLRVEALDKEIFNLTFEIFALALYKTDTEDKSLKSWEPVEVYNLGS